MYKTAALLLCLLSVIACKKEYYCQESILYLRGCQVAFEGYQPEEVDSIRYISYEAGSAFARPVDSGWVYTDSFSVKDNRIYRRIQNDSFAFFVELKAGLDYRISTLSKVHIVTDIATGPSFFEYIRETPCLGGHQSIVPFTSLQVDGDSVVPIETFQYKYFAYLKK